MSSDRPSAFEALMRRIDPGWQVRRAWPLTGGVSAQVTALEIERPGDRPLKLIVRQHGAIDRASNAHIARDEHQLLTLAYSRGLTVSKPYYVDESCELFDVPVVVIEFIEGDTDFEPLDRAGYLARMAAELVRIHAVRAGAELAFLPAQGRGFGERPAALDESMSEGRIREALEAAWPVTQANPAVLLHGDYWPGNILWDDGELAAVIDWEDARTGDALSDLGSARLELLFALGDDAMREFTKRYRSATAVDVVNLPYWDLCAALRFCSRLAGWGLEAAVEQRMRERHAWFVERALEALAGDPISRGCA